MFVLAQSLWMGFFVDMVTGGLPGDLVTKLVLLALASAAMTSVCLGISAMSKSPEKGHDPVHLPRRLSASAFGSGAHTA